MTQMSPAEAIFFASLEIATPAERTAYLEQACGADVDLRRRVERLLAAQPGVGSFLEAPPAVPTGACGGPVEPAPRSEEVGTVLAGKYKLLERIGEGGMGSVFMAEQSAPVRRLVAVKLIKPGMDSKAVLARFEAERQALALMDHPNIAKVLDAGATTDNRPFFVMELVKGVPITKFCDENRLTARQRLELFVPVCQAIQHAHQKGIIHRDIKPTNVLVPLYDGKPVPKVIDFGVAKAAGQPLTELTLHTGFGQIVGTPEYMSPEQATFNQLDIDTRSDVYALGVLLYELLTGTTPVDKARLGQAALLEVLRVVREEEPPRPSVKLSTTEAKASIAASRGTDPDKLTKLMRGELDWIAMKALEKDRSRRYDTAAGLARDVERYLADEMVEARPPTIGYRFRRFVRKRYAFIVILTLVLTLLKGWVFTALRSNERLAIAAAEADAAKIIAEGQRAQAEMSEQKAREAAVDAIKAQKEAEQQKKKAEVNEKKAQAATTEAKGAASETLTATNYYRAFLVENGAGKTIDQVVTAMEPLIDSMKGKDAPVGANMQITLGLWYLRRGEAEKGYARIEKGLAIYRELGGLARPMALNDAMIVALTYQQTDRLDRAARLFEELLPIVKAQEGPTDPNTMALERSLADIYTQAGRYADAVPLWQNAVAGYRQRNMNLILSIALSKLGKCLVMTKQYAAAEPILKECLNLLISAKIPHSRPILPETMNLLGASLLGQKKYPEAEKQLLAFFEVVGPSSDKKIIEGPLRPFVADAVDLLIRLYDETNQPAKAAEWRKRRPEEPAKKPEPK